MKITQVVRNGTGVGTEASGQPPRTGTLGEHEVAERGRGFEEGTMWAREYATESQLRRLVESSWLGSDLGADLAAALGADPGADFAGPYWEGFREGAEEVLATGSRT